MTFNFAFVPVGFILFVIGGFILMIGSSMNTKQTVIKNSTDVKESFERSSLENNKQTIRVKCDYCGTNYEGETCPNCGAKKK